MSKKSPEKMEEFIKDGSQQSLWRKMTTEKFSGVGIIMELCYLIFMFKLFLIL